MPVWNWTDLTAVVTGDQPQRQDCAIAYNPIDNYAILCGGGSAGTSPATAYRYDLTTRVWASYTTTKFKDRAGPNIFWDPVNEKISYMFGQEGSPVYTNDTNIYHWDDVAHDWDTQATTGLTGSTGAQWSAHGIDYTRNVLLAYGGQTHWDNIHRLNLSTFAWSYIADTGKPSDTDSRGMFIHDEVQDLWYYFVGLLDDGVWTLDLNESPALWTEITGDINFIANGYEIGEFRAGAPPFLFWMQTAGGRKIIKLGGHDGSDTTPYSPEMDIVLFDPITYDAEILWATGDPMPAFYPPSVGPHNRVRTHFAFDARPVEDSIYVACGRKFPTTVYADTWFLEIPGDPPELTPVTPVDGATAIVPTSSINFELTASGTIQEPWTVEVDHGEGFELALTYDGEATFTAKYQGPHSAVEGISGGYDVTIDPTIAFPHRQTVQVKVTAEDESQRQVELVV
jgi:hypothetical protein